MFDPMDVPTNNLPDGKINLVCAYNTFKKVNITVCLYAPPGTVHVFHGKDLIYSFKNLTEEDEMLVADPELVKVTRARIRAIRTATRENPDFVSEFINEVTEAIDLKKPITIHTANEVSRTYDMWVPAKEEKK